MMTRILETMVRASMDNRDKDEDNRDNDSATWEDDENTRGEGQSPFSLAI